MSKNPSKIVAFATNIAAEPSSPDPSRLLAGRPVLTTQNHYADGTQQFFSGVWSSTAGKWRVSYAEHEFCSILDGRVRLEADDGSVSEFGPGDSFVIPVGFTGTWETQIACRKLYAIFAPAATPASPKRSVRKRRKSKLGRRAGRAHPPSTRASRPKT